MVKIQKKDLGETHVKVASGFLKLMLAFPGTEKIETNMKDLFLLGTGIAIAIRLQFFPFHQNTLLYRLCLYKTKFSSHFHFL